MKLGIFRFGVASLLFAGLAGCGGGGGGGGGSAAPTITTTAEGVYSGTLSSGNGFDGIILENGTYYMLYGVRSAGTLSVLGFAQGTGTSNNGSFSSTNLKDFYFNGAVFTGSVSASYGTNNNFNGSVTEGAAVTTFTGAAPTNSSYNYNTAANLTNITGAWTLSDMQGGTIAVTIAANGSFTGVGSGGCTSSGTFTPRASGKNVFDMSITFGAAPCVLPNQTATGIAIEYLLANGTRQFVAGGTNAGRTVGTSVFGTR